MTYKLDFESFLDKYDDELYIEYMESGCYYDTEREDFDDWMYEDYMKNPEVWEQKVLDFSKLKVL